MTLERAKKIVGTMTLLFMRHEGIDVKDDEIEPINKLSLATLIRANQMVNLANSNEDKKPFVDGKRSTKRQLVLDDRLIAAIYCVHHYPARTDDTIISVGDSFLCVIPRHAIKFEDAD